jgi:hypothetical protein
LEIGIAFTHPSEQTTAFSDDAADDEDVGLAWPGLAWLGLSSDWMSWRLSHPSEPTTASSDDADAAAVGLDGQVNGCLGDSPVLPNRRPPPMMIMMSVWFGLA